VKGKLKDVSVYPSMRGGFNEKEREGLVTIMSPDFQVMKKEKKSPMRSRGRKKVSMSVEGGRLSEGGVDKMGHRSTQRIVPHLVRVLVSTLPGLDRISVGHDSVA